MSSPNRVGREKPVGSNFELYSWYFFRISGILLVFLAVTHVLIMHVFNTAFDIDYDFVAARWESPFWKSFDWLLLIMALTHGLNGARIAVDDYVRSPGWRVVGYSAILIAFLVFSVLGTIAIVTFEPQ
jgi:succinate dehydrogenase / fumarate reductase, membrane anchor subunit